MPKAVVAAALLVALGVSGLALAATRAEKYKVVANLRAAQEVPKPASVPSAATGLFSATLVESGSSRKLTWKLTFSHLSGKAIAAHVHTGKKGVSGPVVVPLCGPCKSGQKGTAQLTEKVVKAMESGGAYVNVHTQKNQAGEIRGQVKVSS